MRDLFEVADELVAWHPLPKGYRLDIQWEQGGIAIARDSHCGAFITATQIENGSHYMRYLNCIEILAEHPHSGEGGSPTGQSTAEGSRHVH